VVAAKYGYDKYIKKYKDDPRFTFLVLEGRDHNYMFDDDSYRQAFNEEFNKWRDSLDYDPRDKVNYDRFVEDKANYIRENLDREKWSHKRDPELFKQFLDFYDSNM
jgi:hypothetical protein